jgi:hypothetical protein
MNEALKALQRLHDDVNQYFGGAKSGPSWPKYLDGAMYQAREALSALSHLEQEPVAWHVNHRGSCQIFTSEESFERDAETVVSPLYASPFAPVAAQDVAANEVPLNIIRNDWPDGFTARLEHVWRDLIGFTPNYKLYDLQRMLAEFGFTMKVYEGGDPCASGKDARIAELESALKAIDSLRGPFMTDEAIAVVWAKVDAALAKNGGGNG